MRSSSNLQWNALSSSNQITDRSVAAPLLEAVWTLAFHSVAQRTKLTHKFELFFSFEYVSVFFVFFKILLDF